MCWKSYSQIILTHYPSHKCVCPKLTSSIELSEDQKLGLNPLFLPTLGVASQPLMGQIPSFPLLCFLLKRHSGYLSPHYRKFWLLSTSVTIANLVGPRAYVLIWSCAGICPSQFETVSQPAKCPWWATCWLLTHQVLPLKFGGGHFLAARRPMWVTPFQDPKVLSVFLKEVVLEFCAQFQLCLHLGTRLILDLIKSFNPTDPPLVYL